MIDADLIGLRLPSFVGAFGKTTFLFVPALTLKNMKLENHSYCITTKTDPLSADVANLGKAGLDGGGRASRALGDII